MSEQMSKRRGIVYLLPNLFTTAALFCGFYSLLASTDGRYRFAVILIFVAMVLDACDGRVARLTGTTSEFGVQYDSLSDLVSFGVAPAMLMYQWSVHLMAEAPMVPTRLGWMAAFIYAACTALRLARFNVQVNEVDKAVFIGLPSPAAAGVVSGFVWLGIRLDWQPKNVMVVAAALLVLSGLAMVSNFRYFSGKSMKLKGYMPFRYAIIPVVVLGFIFLEPEIVLPILFFVYGVHGPIWLLWRVYHRRRQRC